MSTECTFCEIVAGRLPSHRVLDDGHAIAFLDIRPAAEGHTLVIPRAHARDVWAIPAAAHGQVSGLVHRVAALLRSALEPDGLSITSATGAAAGQEVFHFHVHVIPRWRDDGLRPMPAGRPASARDLEQVAQRIAAAGSGRQPGLSQRSV